MLHNLAVWIIIINY